MPGARRRGVRRGADLTAVALGATGLVVAAGVLTGAGTVGPLDGSAAALSAASPTAAPLSERELAERTERASRSEGDRSVVRDRGKARTLASGAGSARTRSQDLADVDPKTLARTLMPRFGISASEFGCLDSLWSGESGWRVDADNPSSSAYGIPQALPGSKMASAGADWATNPATQIKWGLGYIRDRYGSACNAESFKQGNGWY